MYNNLKNPILKNVITKFDCLSRSSTQEIELESFIIPDHIPVYNLDKISRHSTSGSERFVRLYDRERPR